jgi:endonuclease G
MRAHRRTSLMLALAALLAGSVPSAASPTTCPDKFAGGLAPDLLNPKLSARTAPLCFSAFALLHSGTTRGALWSAEHLTRDNLRRAKETDRVNAFHAEALLPVSDRSELSDYSKSGYDRGHLAPSGDMPDPASQNESFSLSNMIPQDPDNNRGLWEGVESATRSLAMRQGELYVVTGPIFHGTDIKALRGRVLVPTHIFKAVYDPRTGRAGAYLVGNAPGMVWKAISIAELSTLSGIDPFPALPVATKAVAMSMPEPTPHGFNRGGESASSGTGGGVVGYLEKNALWLTKKVLRSW